MAYHLLYGHNTKGHSKIKKKSVSEGSICFKMWLLYWSVILTYISFELLRGSRKLSV